KLRFFIQNRPFCEKTRSNGGAKLPVGRAIRRFDGKIPRFFLQIRRFDRAVRRFDRAVRRYGGVVRWFGGAVRRFGLLKPPNFSMKLPNGATKPWFGGAKQP